ncbi:MAG: hypothetical protein AUJ08_05955 [Thaumarchaeota archaeon 13_1_40CM_3_50_5]|nr:MAG: hypothetical protein AUJ08_05955 [Thaumarchaeota archaeon 13_1_40CM_3_50_5]
MSVKVTVARPKLMTLKRRMESVGGYMTDGEIEAPQAMLRTDYTSSVPDDTLTGRRKAPVIQPYGSAED